MSLKDKIINSPIVQVPVNISKKIVLPGFDGLPIYDVVEFFYEGAQKSSITTRASSLAFKFFLALFPLIIFVFTLIPYIPIENFHEQLMALIQSVLPQNAYELTESTLDDLINNKHNQLLSFGFIFGIYLSTNGINAMLRAFNSSYHIEGETNWLKQRLIALLLLIIMMILVVLAIGLIIFSGTLIEYLIHKDIIHDDYSIYFITAGKFIVLIFLYFIGISSIYYFGNLRSKKFRFISAGSTLATLLSILLSYGFAFYVNNFSTYNKLYGSIGTLIVILLWIYFNAMVLLIGFELNASIRHAREIKASADQ